MLGFLILTCNLCLDAQNDTSFVNIDSKYKNKKFLIPDHSPEPSKGSGEIIEYVISSYQIEEHQDIQLKFNLMFIIDDKGIIKDVAICNKSRKDYSLDEKTMVDLLMKMPPWKPGILKNKPVWSYYFCPLYIRPTR